jgi:hypothetical protein
MRRISIARGVVALSFAVLVAVSASAAQTAVEAREQSLEKERTIARIVRVIRKSIRSLGDGLTIPRP